MAMRQSQAWVPRRRKGQRRAGGRGFGLELGARGDGGRRRVPLATRSAMARTRWAMGRMRDRIIAMVA